ncbi:HipA domain-containing protein [Bosea sp. 685]|uniref:type II toxin-antitoxin system HipA family toxin n=1 Tax=Bosea sp. 685 TaxID=3080057 RepID=UPI00289339DF|nr:HipA domain-containing protein [Bosea sp. 685]WNJ89565.1 HipA domain-containing protein [Bosea sp. 685]
MKEIGCFVYMTLPGRTEAVVAGRLEIEQTGIEPVGRFVYGQSYLGNPDAVPIDPMEIAALENKVFTHVGDNGMFWAFRDSSPDFWGRTVIQRALGAELDEVGYLLNSPDDRAGALGFGTGPRPPAPERKFNRTLDLEELQQTADDILADREVVDRHNAEQVERLLLHGTSMGGARPKAVVEDGEALWIAKFSRQDDTYNVPIVEHSMLELARECGISTAQSKLVTIGGRHVLMVKRFDRDKADCGWLRYRMVSGLTTLETGESDRSRWSYPILADAVRRLSSNFRSDLDDLFRRVTFNMLISNDDDHPRNHALLARNRSWSLSPAYDLTPRSSIATSRFLAMSMGNGNRAATKENLFSELDRFMIETDEAEEIVAKLSAIIERRWYGICRENGLPEADCERIRLAFGNEGFDWAEPVAPTP